MDMDSFLKQGYRVKHGYHDLFPEHPKLPWCNLVWDRLIIPKNRFIVWLVFWKRLNTKERVSRYQSIDTTCVLCGNEDETTEDIVKLLHACHHSKRFNAARKSMVSTIIASLVYHIWKARNEVLWNQELWLTSTAVQKSKQLSLLRIKAFPPRKAKDEDIDWIMRT
ncbi:hypothetical protein F8388_004705 [Cannabis sativa]|uniref:Reverse transcriptase zinc-binding domain-containing protein n=1 Tax=Cannabis sativa TaxID=3483 RepID=A0A7J6HN94_CANSA|nr:hypothetical protein F8388_004705 [Cannabis sativa]